MNIGPKVPLTTFGAEKLKAQLQELKTIARPKIIQAIAEARANGDLKENADYHAAREQQAFIEGKILELENKLANCQIIDVGNIINDGKIMFGATVSLMMLIDQTSDHKLVKYQIVGEEEADLKNSKISISSPVARALIGKYVGDVVDVMAPSGNINYEITAVEYI